MDSSNYRFFLQSDAFVSGQTGDCECSTGDVYNCREAFPVWGNDLAIVWGKYDDEIFYRKELSRSLEFRNFAKDGVVDYTTIKNLNFDDEVEICIVKNISGTWTNIFDGKFTHQNCTFDEDQCIVEVDVIPKDIYDVALSKGGVKWNIMNLLDYTVTRNVAGDVFEYCKRMSEVIQYLINKFDVEGLTYMSTFFENDLTTDTDNYVTTTDPNPLNFMTISQKSDIKAEVASGAHPGSFANATNGEISFFELMDILRQTFDVRWFIDSDNNYLRIEHISWFTDNVGIFDLTTLENNFAGITYASEINRYNFIQAPIREEWSYQEKNSIILAFGDWFYEYDIPSDGENTLSHSPKAVNNDLNMFDSGTGDPDSISPEGWVLFQTYLDSGTRKVNTTNALFYWSAITDNYWMHNRPYKYCYEGDIASSEEFWSQKTLTTKRKIKLQQNITWHGCDEIFSDSFDPNDLVVTELGNGEIRTISYNLSSGHIDGDLLFEGPDNNQPVIPTDLYEDETITILDRMITQPTDARKQLMDDLVSGLKTDGIWAKLDALWVFGCHTNDHSEAMINWIDPGDTDCTLEGTTEPSFVANKGFTSNGTTGYIDTHFNPGTPSGAMAQNDATMGFYTNTARPGGGGSIYDMGCYDGSVDYSHIGFVKGGDYLAALNSGGNVNIVIVDTQEGLIAVTRTNATQINFHGRYDSGDPDRNSTVANNSQALPSANIYICARNANGSAAGFTTRQYSAAFVGTYITQANVDDLHDRLKTYFDAL